MKSIIHRSVTGVFAAAVLAIGSSAFASGSLGSLNTGEPADSSAYARVIVITPTTKSVDVEQDEVVKFVNTATGKSFVWDFDTASWADIDLSTIAPPGVISAHVKAYVNDSMTD